MQMEDQESQIFKPSNNDIDGPDIRKLDDIHVDIENNNYNN